MKVFLWVQTKMVVLLFVDLDHGQQAFDRFVFRFWGIADADITAPSAPELFEGLC